MESWGKYDVATICFDTIKKYKNSSYDPLFIE